MTAIPEDLRGRKGALLAAAVAGGALLLILLGFGYLVFGGQSADTEEATHQLAVYRAEAAMQPALEAELRQVRAQAAQVPGLIVSDSAALAQAQLQDEVKSIVTANQGEVRTAQIVPVSAVDGFEIIAIQYDLMLPMAKLADLTYAIESHSPYLFIEDADITSQQDFQSGDPQTANPMVEVRWTIHGYRWGGGK
ncbi:MAG TPA: type II secretion system protein GspM [Rhizomicrobium sp.]|nr:type II secretion system protein GspM [Rhizomicrobium sp.]